MRVAIGIQLEAFDQTLGQVATCAFGQHGDFGVDINAGGEAGFVRAVLGHTHIADAHADDLAGRVMQGFGCRKAGVDFHAQCFCLRCQPCTHGTQADDDIAVIGHTWRRWQFVAAGFGEQPELIMLGIDANRRWIAAPIGQQRIQRAGFDHCTGQDVRADVAGLFDHAHGDFGIELLESNGKRQPGRAATNCDDVVFHHVAFDGRGSRLVHADLLGLTAIVRALIRAGNPEPQFARISAALRGDAPPARAPARWSKPSRQFALSSYPMLARTR